MEKQKDSRFGTKPNSFILFILITLHVLGISSFFVAISWKYFLFCFCMYLFRVFVLHGGCHRLFSHRYLNLLKNDKFRSFKTSRWFQLFLAFWGCSTIGNSPLFWATHHRIHHQHADTVSVERLNVIFNIDTFSRKIFIHQKNTDSGGHIWDGLCI